MRYSVIFRPESSATISIEMHVATIHEGKVTLRLSQNTKFYIDHEDENGVLIGEYIPQYSVKELPVMFIPETHPLFNCYIVNSSSFSRLKYIRSYLLEFQLLALYAKVLFKSKEK